MIKETPLEVMEREMREEAFLIANSTQTMNKYCRQISDVSGHTITVDVYDVLKAFDVKCPALQHLIKKALCVGIRGHKDKSEDLKDIRDSAIRALELNNE